MKKTLILFIYLPMVLLGQTFNGMTLFAPMQGGGGGSFNSYLVNNDMDVIKRFLLNVWNCFLTLADRYMSDFDTVKLV